MFRFALSLIVLSSAAAQGCNEDDHHPENGGYFYVGAAGLSDQTNLDSAHGQRLPNNTWAPGIYYPYGQNRICNPATERSCRPPCDTVGCPDMDSTHTCSILQFCPPEGSSDSYSVHLMPSFEATDACDFSEAEFVGRTNIDPLSPCVEYVFEVDHELREYHFASEEGCSQGMRVGFEVDDFTLTADQCAVIGLTTPRIDNCDCLLQIRPSTLGEPCRTAFSDSCLSVSQQGECCETGTCISTLEDFTHPVGRQKEMERRDACDDTSAGLCYNVDGQGSDTNGEGSTDCCTKKCSECGTELSPFAQWKPCTSYEAENKTAECGFLGRYDRSPYVCDFTLCDEADTWHPESGSFKVWTGESTVVVTFPSSTLCFPGEAKVETPDGLTALKDIKIGDSVKLGDGSFDTVYSFGHFDSNVIGEYLELSSDSAAIKISHSHMVFTEAGAVPASAVAVGNKLALANGGVMEVSKIKTVKSKGAYAPFTFSGKIVVDGVVASNYVALNGGSSIMGFSMQWLAHLFNAPHRLAFNLGFTSETYNEEGVSNWVAQPLEMAQWFVEQSTFVQAAAFVPAFAVVSLIGLLEQCPLAAVVAVLTVLYTQKRKNKIAA